MQLLPLIFCFFIISCATVSHNGKKPESFVGIKGGSLRYSGEITKTSNQVIFAAFNNLELKPKRLLIDSIGGEIGAGIELGSWVRRNRLDVEVTNICASSCANYVFPAGKAKYLRKDSILLWHGSAWQTSWSDELKLDDTFNKYITSMREKETDFFSVIEVDNLLCTYGQFKITFWDYLQNMMGKGTEGYDYSVADMKKFGLSNIVLLDGEWDWRKYRPNQLGLVKRVKVDEGFKLKIRRFGV